MASSFSVTVWVAAVCSLRRRWDSCRPMVRVIASAFCRLMPSSTCSQLLQGANAGSQIRTSRLVPSPRTTLARMRLCWLTTQLSGL